MPAKKWTLKEDKFLVEFWESIGPSIAEHDLGRSEKQARKRVEHLKETGAWFLLERLFDSEYVWLRQYHEALGDMEMVEVLDATHHGATIVPPNFWSDAEVKKPASHLKIVK